jgi:hypothetical protein
VLDLAGGETRASAIGPPAQREEDLLALLLLPQQLPNCILILIFEFARLKVASLRIDNVRGQIEHIFWNLLVRDVVEYSCSFLIS